MLTIAGLREEYHGLKSNLLARSPPVQFNELHGLLGDHDYMIRSTINTSPAPPQAFIVTTAVTSPASTPTLASIQQQIANLQLMASQLGIQPQPLVPQP
ncbi:hypothetical protein HanPSC8_Chr11g0489401 [Helianthus annuus]|nr:hypothetical protein HanPSC8_Chr11g0489401 [Helianthus annuus]